MARVRLAVSAQAAAVSLAGTEPLATRENSDERELTAMYSPAHPRNNNPVFGHSLPPSGGHSGSGKAVEGEQTLPSTSM